MLFNFGHFLMFEVCRNYLKFIFIIKRSRVYFHLNPRDSVIIKSIRNSYNVQNIRRKAQNRSYISKLQNKGI